MRCRRFSRRHCDDADLDQIGRPRQRGLDGGPGGRIAGGDPSVPDLVHFVESIDVSEPDVRREDPRLVAARLAEQPVDLRQDLLSLGAHRRHGIVGDLPRQIDEPAMDHGLAHARANVKSTNHAGVSPLRLAARRWKSAAPAVMKLFACSYRNRQPAATNSSTVSLTTSVPGIFPASRIAALAFRTIDFTSGWCICAG